MEHLRSIALTVEENGPNQFTWLLLESQGDGVVFDVELECADQPFPAYIKALKAGFERLAALGADEAMGPREEGEEAGADPPGQDPYGGNR